MGRTAALSNASQNAEKADKAKFAFFGFLEVPSTLAPDYVVVVIVDKLSTDPVFGM